MHNELSLAERHCETVNSMFSRSNAIQTEETRNEKKEESNKN